MAENKVKLEYNHISDLKSKYEIKLSKYSSNAVFLKSQKTNLDLKALALYNQGDYENAFIMIMQQISMWTYVLSNSKKAEKEKYEAQLGYKLKKAMELAEKLKNILNELYAKKNDSCKANDVLEIPEQPESVKEIDERDSSFISAAQVFTTIKSQDSKILLIDTRRESDFKESHIDKLVQPPSEIINIPEHLIKKGLSASKLGNTLPSSILPTWRERGTFDKVIIFQWDGSDGPAFILQNIMEKFDLLQYKKKIAILEGGYKEWMDNYDYYTSKKLNVERPSVKRLNLDNIVYLNFNVDDDNDDEEELKIYLDKPSKNSSIPYVDRSSKAAALKKYEDRSNDRLTLLREKEETVKEALEVEKERLQRERQLQDELRRQKEQEIDNEMRNILMEEGARILKQLEELTHQSKEKDEKIKELEIRLNGYEKDSSPTNQEKIVEDTIKNHEREAEVLKRERQKLETEHGTDRKKLEKSFNNRNNQNTIFVKPEPPKIPHVDRSNKPKQQQELPIPIIGQSPGLTGLKNLGNTCYMNSILQCISNNRILARYFIEDLYKSKLNRNHNEVEVVEQVAGVMRDLWSGNCRAVACDKLRETVGCIKSEYRTYEQQDSHEFLTFLLDWLHNGLKQDDKLPKSDRRGSEVGEAWFNFISKNESYISRVFYGLQRSTVTCSRCGERSSTYEPFSNLSLIIPERESITLSDCLRLYLKKEVVTGWRCPKCKEDREAEKINELCRLPRTLVIHLKRFSFLDIYSKKRTTYVDFPLEGLMLDSECDSKPFNLYAVSNHYGTMEGGHYTAYCQSFMHKRWYRFDDHEVVEVSPNSVKTSAAYILFYEVAR